MSERRQTTAVVTIAFLITGNLVGAGILALPIKTGLAGFVPSLLAMLVVGGAMYFSAVVLGAEATRTREPTFNYPSLYQNYLGAAGKWLAVAANLLILYGLLTAYRTGAATIITGLFDLSVSDKWIVLLFFVVVTGLCITDIRAVQKYNFVLMILLWASFAVLVIMSERHVKLPRLAHTDWLYLPSAVPIIVTAFYFHNIIPNVCHGLDWRSSAIWKTMLLGMVIGYVMNALWIQVAAGALPLTGSDVSIAAGLANDQPATVLLSKELNSSLFMTCSMLFALLAVATSYLANGMGLMGFIEDLTKNTFGRSSRVLTIGLSFAPPLIIALIYPDIFLKALDVVGGVGIVLLFGILPSMIAFLRWRSVGKRSLALIMLVLFLIFLLFELGQEFGLLAIKPHVEYWKHGMGQ